MNKYLGAEVGATEFPNFFAKLEHSISISKTHGIITRSEFYKAHDRLIKKFVSSLEKGKYSAVNDIFISFGVDDILVKHGDNVDLVKINKNSKTVSLVVDGYEYDLGFQVMLNFTNSTGD